MIEKKRKTIYLTGFLFAINIALTSYISSSFLESFINVDYIGIVYTISAIITIIGLFMMPRLMSKYGNKNIAILVSSLSFLSLVFMSFSNTGFIVIPAFILYFASGNFFIANLDIFLEEYSNSKDVGKTRGLYLTFINIAWVVAQMISGSIIAKSSYSGIYLFSAGLMALVTGTLILFFNKFEDPIYKKMSVLKTVKFFIKDRNVSKIYLINLILKFFYAWMVIYTPIYLHQYLGFGWEKIGLIFTIMLLPFVILDIPLGGLSDKIGEKKILIIGFIVTTIFTLLIPFISSTSWIIWAFILFCTRIGAATIEIMSEIYFFKIVSVEKSDEISFFRNTLPISYILGPLIAVPVLLLVPSFEFLFFVLGAIMLLGILLTSRLKDVK
ncbi:MAG: MFS transporter [Candidatus Nomurabacteria bacterium]|nr:MFS transporter [Candidatus Nomurabacteria bacterium]